MNSIVVFRPQAAVQSREWHVTVTAVLPHAMSPIPRYYRAHATRYRGNTARFYKKVPITAVITAVTAKIPR